jgi:hypothetical protein
MTSAGAHRAWTMLVAGAAAVSCTGIIGGDLDDPARSAPAGADAGGVLSACSDPKQRGMAEVSAQRMIRPEIVNTLTDLLGASVVADSAIQIQLGLLATDQIHSSASELQLDPPDT